MKRVRLYMVFGVALCMVLALNIGWTEAKPIIIKISHDTAPTGPKSLAFAHFKQLVDQRLAGKVEVQHYHSGQLFKSDEESVSALQAGAVQMVGPTAAKWQPLVPEFSLFTLPYIFANTDMMKEALRSPKIGGKIIGKLKEKGLHYLTVWDNGFRQQINSKRPIIEPQDLKGLKIRIQSSKVFEAYFKQAGANPQVIAWSETPTALQQGVIDGLECATPHIWAGKFHELAHYISFTNHVYSAYIIATNEKFWSGLPEDIRASLEQCMKETTDWQWEANKKTTKDYIDKVLAAQQAQVIFFSKKDMAKWAEFFRPIHKQFEKTVGADVLDTLYDLAKKYQ
jgi:C4-dicarboxylate-binding protein DctP